MVQDSTDALRVNARKTDAFDVFNLKHYIGPNPYLNTAALVFDCAFTGYLPPRPLVDYISMVGERYPQLRNRAHESYFHLLAQTVSEVGKLDIDLHLNRWNLKSYGDYTRIGVQALHARTQRAVIYLVWDWFEAITQGQVFEFEAQLKTIQETFRRSVYGGPTVYSLLRTAYEKQIPTFYLWSEGLVQYGYGRKQVRGSATTFNGDSHLDSDFTTRKDDCKDFLHRLGFPVPQGDIVVSLAEALTAADEIGYPVAVKPVVGHKGIGVTANVQDPGGLKFAFTRALKTIGKDQPMQIIVEKSISGADARLLCVNGRFVAATERRPASVVGDGFSTIAQLIKRENRTRARMDTPTSPLSKIQRDEAMEMYLSEQGLSQGSVIEADQTVYLRKVANLSAGGVSIDVTYTVHLDNIILAQDVAQHFQLTCLGIDVIAQSLAKSWKEGNFGIIEINAAPGISMHLNPAVGQSIDVPSYILETFFQSGMAARIPVVTFNRISVPELQEVIDHIHLQDPNWTIGAVCREAILLNRAEKVLNYDYNSNVQNLLRHPGLDLLIAEYSEEILDREGMFYQGSNVVVLDNPTETEMMLARDVFDDSTIIIRQGDNITIQCKGLMEQYKLGPTEPLTRVYLKEIAKIL